MNSAVRAQSEARNSKGRQVAPELLDRLPSDDPRAIQSRRELRRVNAWMGNAGILARGLQAVSCEWQPRSLIEIGGGDGTLMLETARRLGHAWSGITLRIVDQQALVSSETVTGYQALGWRVEPIQADVMEWLSRAPSADLMIANLFLHHFEQEELSELLRRASGKVRAFIACEPRRFTYPNLAGQLLRLICCGPVTRHDAAASVRAGFVGQELSTHWPRGSAWWLTEREAGFFSHSFCAIRV